MASRIRSRGAAFEDRSRITVPERCTKLLVDPKGNFAKELLLRGEVRVEGALRYVGAGGDIGDSGVQEPVLLEHLLRRSEDSSTCAGTLLGQRAGWAGLGILLRTSRPGRSPLLRGEARSELITQ